MRGFPVTRASWARRCCRRRSRCWRFQRRWGVAAFAGAGSVGDRFGDLRSGTKASSYGVGLRYMVLESQRINLRIDYARAEGSSAAYLSVAEAF